MAAEQRLLSTEIVDPDGVVRVRRRLSDFVNSVNLKYVKLGYYYLIRHGVYMASILALLLFSGAEIGSLKNWKMWRRLWDSTAGHYLATVIGFVAVFCAHCFSLPLLRPRSIYLLDFACYKPHDDS